MSINKKLVYIGLLLTLILMMGLFLLSSLPASPKEVRNSVDAYGRKPVSGEDYEPGIILFGLKNGQLSSKGQAITSKIPVNEVDNTYPSLSAIFEKYGATSIFRPILDSEVLGNVYQLNISKGDVLSIMTELQRNPDIEFAEPSYYANLAYVPNDPYFSSSGSWGQDYDDQWNLKIIDMPRAWDITKGEPSVVVAVVDSGVDHLNPDLAGNVVEGYYMRVGKSIVYTKGFPGDCYSTHGTHIAGIIAAKGSDSFGVIGIAPQVKIMPFASMPPCEQFPPKTLYQFVSGSGNINPIASAVPLRLGALRYVDLFLLAEKEHVDIISFSSTFPYNSFVLNKAVDHVTSKGIVFVNAAGNDNKSVLLGTPSNNPNAIVVAATIEDDTRAYYSNWGPTVTVAAPGGNARKEIPSNILSTGSTETDLMSLKFLGKESLNVGNYHIRLSGTSMAAPHVSGLAALVKSLHPDWSIKQIRCAIILGAEDKGEPGWDPYYGYGRINAYNTLKIDNPSEDCTPVAQITSPSTNSGLEISSFVINGTASSKDIDYLSLEYLAEGSSDWHTIMRSSRNTIGDLGIWNMEGLEEGNYLLRLTVKDKSGQQAVHQIPIYLFEEKAAKSSTTTSPSGTSELKWKFKTSGWVQTPTLANNKIYFTSFTGPDNFLYAIDINTGHEKWRKEIGGTKGLPVVSENLVYVGNGNGIQIFDAETGEIKVKTPMEVGSATKPIIQDGIIYFGAGDGYLYATDQNLQEKWKLRIPGGMTGTPISDGSVLYVGAGKNMYAIDLVTRQQKWKFESKKNFVFTPELADGTLYFGSGDNYKEYYLHVVNAQTGQLKWSVPVTSSATPAIDGNTVYYNSGTYLYAADITTGKTQWTFQADRGVGHPVVAGNVVYFGSYAGWTDFRDQYHFAIDKDTGKELWRFKTGDTVSTPVVFENVIYFGSRDQYLYAVKI